MPDAFEPTRLGGGGELSPQGREGFAPRVSRALVASARKNDMSWHHLLHGRIVGGAVTAAYIYGLVDPRTNFIRYVGKSVDPQIRLSRHLRPHSTDSPKTYCARWIRSLKTIGLEPTLTILEGPCENWEEAERRWIASFPLGQLTNLTSGGDGVHDLIRTPEHCAAIGRANKGRVWTPEARAKQSKAQKARFAGGLTEKERAYRSIAGKARKNTSLSPEARAKISAARSGSKASPATRAKMSASHRARHVK